MATTAQVATLAWTCDQSETFDVSESIALPGWTTGYLAGGRWLMQARYPLNNPQAALNFDSNAGDGSLTQLSVASGAGLDSLGNPIAGVTVALEFQQAEDVVRCRRAGNLSDLA
jgi:hypothetical protein